MIDIFRQVSDIIDMTEKEAEENNDGNESIRTAYHSGDYHGAALMLKTVIKL